MPLAGSDCSESWTERKSDGQTLTADRQALRKVGRQEALWHLLSHASGSQAISRDTTQAHIWQAAVSRPSEFSTVLQTDQRKKDSQLDMQKDRLTNGLRHSQPGKYSQIFMHPNVVSLFHFNSSMLSSLQALPRSPPASGDGPALTGPAARVRGVHCRVPALAGPVATRRRRAAHFTLYPMRRAPRATAPDQRLLFQRCRPC